MREHFSKKVLTSYCRSHIQYTEVGRQMWACEWQYVLHNSICQSDIPHQINNKLCVITIANAVRKYIII
jgi:hypothetical protein